ncbi:SpaA isopeptide-forming pilin-related protein [Faecalicatena contorta]|uniref:SpaA isopeptide-forming pilin-related protein n=1 Tax=Faecalicatena contorta TaxID=39482 RepID=UPI001F369AC0|nr:SpaA isopeptide-forming pilin-related protein [Faecalicatena contorta]MCF2668282.1 Cna protein B-type domain protein [Faecalicatena contorta]
MKFKRKTMRIVSGMLTAITLFTNALSPVIAYAAPADEADSRIPYYEEIKDQLDQDEVVTARDIEVTVGSGFDVKADFSGIEIPDSEKAKVKLMAAQNDEGKEFSTDHADIYKTVYSVEPQKTDHPVYQISRNITVKDVSKEADTTVNSDSSSDQDSGTGETEESEDSDDESETDSSEMKQPETDEAVNVSEAETETEVTGKEITEEEFDAEIESTENQETVDPETGTTLSEVMEEAVDQGIALNELEAGEMVTFEMPMLLAAAETGSQSVSITRGSWYHYADYGLGSYITAPYYVSWGGIKATAYCVQPSKNGPDDGTYSITKLSDGKTLAKVCYYGTKASDENGFFDEKHPDFSAGKRFIITHLAAAYANGSSDWDSGTNATGRSLAKELYNYCINMPDIPDVDMSFSDSDVNAYVEGNIQRTKTITFKADELQTITFKLPQGVKLVNVTTGKTSAAGASVEICGGTQFYLTAPLSQAEDVGALFSSKMKGSIDKEYSAYKITTGSSTQDLALVFGEGVGNEKYVDFKVTWTKECYISIVKKDSETSNTLAGAVYGIYSDAACTQLIKQMPATDANGAAKVTIEKTQEVVYLKEISVPTGYTIDAKAYNVTLNIGKTSNMNVTDKRVTATISLHKQDAETGNTPQGDATLKGAVYGLFAREDIVHPDGKTGVLYKKGTQITSLTTDKNGQASVSNLYLGKYYFKELTPPVGYLLDQEEHEVDCSYEGANVPVVERKAISKEDVIKQPFQIIKAANNGKTDADLLKGIGFSAWLASDLKVKADGSYDFSSANPVVITADGKTEMFTDEKGYACSIPLPYGTYVVKETTSKHNYEPVDDFIVTINENHPDTPQVWRVLLDKEFEAKLKIIKKDDETKKSVLLANTEFKVYDLDHQKYVEQVTTYPSTKVHKSYFTDANGYLILPNNLKIGNYRIEEVTAPEGYTQSSAYVTVSVDTNTAYMIDPTSKDAIIEVEYENHPVKGDLTIFKQGELLAGYDHDFQYELCGLKGVTFEVYAAEDIFTADHQMDENGNRTLYYAKDALVAKVTTDEDGYAYVKDLPLGEYYVKESKAPEGFVHNENSEKAVFVYADQNTPVVFDQVSFTNERQKVSISVEKQDADNGNVVPGAVFGIYNAEDIINKDGQVIIKADTLLQEMTSDEDGQAKCTLDLPLGQYYVKELHAPAGFVSSDEILSFDASYQGQDIQTVELKAVKKNEPTVVKITKSDITTGEELDGAYLQVLDQNGNIIDSWESSKDESHVIKRLTVGETYILREQFAPYGYLVANDITFTIEDTAEIQKVEMKDEVPVAELILNKKGEFLNEVSLVDQIKGVVEHIFHYITGSLTDVTFEVYAEEDIKAADGVSEDYYKADELVATMTTDETGITKLSNLPLGKYYVKEVGTAHGYVLDSEIRHVDLSYVDQNTPVVTYNDDWKNHRQRVIINLVKKEKDQDRVLEGGVFGLYAKEDIKSSTTGKVLIEADEIIELKSTDAEGKITFMTDLPIDAEYYVKELYAPAGFVNAEEVQEFTVSYAGENEDSVVVDLTFEDEATTVEITKTDLTGGKEIPGCKLKLVDEDGNTVEEWTSTEEAHVIKELVVGKKYTLVETQPADGYVTAESIEFTVENTAEIQKHQMKDDVTKVEISKQDIAGKELPGAKLTILDKDGKVVESWTSTKKAHHIEMLPIGKYTLREETAPDGYLVANDVEFEVKDTGEVQHVTMVDEAKPAVQADTPKTGDERNMKLWLLLLGIGAGGLGVAFGIRRKRK